MGLAPVSASGPPLALAAALLLLQGCGGGATLDPPEISYGQDVCVQCGMIVSDERFAAATVERDAGGRVSKAILDDFGCLLARETAGATMLRRWVRAHAGDAWIDAERATFLHSRAIHSPMAFGLAAFADPAKATEAGRTLGGDVLRLADVRDRYAAGTLAWLPDALETDRSDP
jgi:copper chaperone NosL